jgi:hypothetical protein
MNALWSAQYEILSFHWIFCALSFCINFSSVFELFYCLQIIDSRKILWKEQFFSNGGFGQLCYVFCNQKESIFSGRDVDEINKSCLVLLLDMVFLLHVCRRTSRPTVSHLLILSQLKMTASPNSFCLDKLFLVRWWDGIGVMSDMTWIWRSWMWCVSYMAGTVLMTEGTTVLWWLWCRDNCDMMPVVMTVMWLPWWRWCSWLWCESDDYCGDCEDAVMAVMWWLSYGYARQNDYSRSTVRWWLLTERGWCGNFDRN